MNWSEWKEREKMYTCWLCNFPYIGNKQLYRLLEACGGSEGVYLASPEVWESVLSPEQVARLKAYTAEWRPEKSYDRMRERGIRIVTVKDEEYPERLKHISDPPYGLFVRGKLPEETMPAVAVIGARECSEYGKYVAKQLGTVLGRCRITVISGMARGIDCISQEAALEAGGCSAGILGCGVDVCYPAQNRDLYNRLVETGAVLSSYPLGTPALPQNFPPRNRIVSGLADAVVVVEARIKSGTLITVDMALEQGREVYVIPGRVTDRLSDGCNRLIRQGAGVLLDPEGFVEELWELYERKGGTLKSNIPTGESWEPSAVDGTYQRALAGTREPYEASAFAGISPKDLAGTGGLQEASPCKSESRKTLACKGDSQGSTVGIREPQLPPALTAVYEVLDFDPRSTEEIRGKLPEKFREQQIVSCLMQLCMKKLAIQVSPGRFCRIGE